MSKLTNEEISFLRWLRENGGRRAVSVNNDLRDHGRLIDSRYVEVRPNRFSADAVYFKITTGGRQVLETIEMSIVATAADTTRTASAPRTCIPQ